MLLWSRCHDNKHWVTDTLTPECLCAVVLVTAEDALLTMTTPAHCPTVPVCITLSFLILPLKTTAPPTTRKRPRLRYTITEFTDDLHIVVERLFCFLKPSKCFLNPSEEYKTWMNKNRITELRQHVSVCKLRQFGPRWSGAATDFSTWMLQMFYSDTLTVKMIMQRRPRQSYQPIRF